jgi:transcriptional regulator with XRE-family HTH domain
LSHKQTIMRNTLEKIVTERELNPSDSTLEKIGISRKKYTRILNNTSELSLQEAASLAQWLNVPMEDLFEAPTNVASRHQLVKA